MVQALAKSKKTAETQEVPISQEETAGSGDFADWIDEDGYEGELSVDVYQDDTNLYIKSPVAGVTPESLEITINNDMLTIRGFREQEQEVNQSDYYFQECYWGGFSRSVILPTDVKSDEIEAELKHGILTIRLPKVQRNRTIPVAFKDS